MYAIQSDAAEIDALKQRVAELEGALLASSSDNAALKATGEQLPHRGLYAGALVLRAGISIDDRSQSEAQLKVEQTEKRLADIADRLQVTEQKRDAANNELETAISKRRNCEDSKRAEDTE